MNKLIVIGRVGKDAEVKQVGGKSVINFSVASSETWKDKEGNKQERTTWFDAAIWREQTAIAQYITKGTQVYLEGTVNARAFMDKENQPKGSIVVNVQNIQLLSTKQEVSNQPITSTQAQAPSSKPSQTFVTSEPLDDLPF